MHLCDEMVPGLPPPFLPTAKGRVGRPGNEATTQLLHRDSTEIYNVLIKPQLYIVEAKQESLASF